MFREGGEVRQAALSVVGPLVVGRTVILAGAVVRGARMVAFLQDAGATVRKLDAGPTPPDTRARFAHYEHFLAEPDEDTLRRLDELDPDKRALIYGGSFTAVQILAGRPLLGRRKRQHFAAERKDRQREILRAPSRIVPCRSGLDASIDLPTVLQGVPIDGVAMAASHTFLLPRLADHDRVLSTMAELRRDCTSAIISELTIGTPCTFYGFVTNNEVIEFGPVEALVVWNRRTWRLSAPGVLRPLPLHQDVLAEARAAVRSAARRLHEKTGYVGAFGTDGVVASDRYVIHEINPRVCAGFSLLDQLMPTASPLAAIDIALRESPALASAKLCGPLAALAAELAADNRFAYRLWDEPQAPPAPADHLGRAESIRRSVATGELASLNIHWRQTA
jgi:hypothetical protein